MSILIWGNRTSLHIYYTLCETVEAGSVSREPELAHTQTLKLTRGLCRTELLEVTVCSPSCIMAISPLSSEPSARLLTELLWELALIDMDGREWELSMLLTVPVRSIYCSTSWERGQTGSLKKDGWEVLGKDSLLHNDGISCSCLHKNSYPMKTFLTKK